MPPREELDASFEQGDQSPGKPVMNILLTSEGDREMFRKVYPFSPALVQTLIAVSSRAPAGTYRSQGDDAAPGGSAGLSNRRRYCPQLGICLMWLPMEMKPLAPTLAIHFDNAKRLYHLKLLPILEKQHGKREDLDKLPIDDPKRVAFRNDDRLVKTLLLSALVPEVESLRGLNAERLAALNHGTIRSPIPGREAGGEEVLRRCRDWAGSVGEIRIGEENTTNPSISVQLSGVDTDTILRQAEGIDNRGNRIRLMREMVFAQLGLASDETECTYSFTWKNTKRTCTILFMNIRELSDFSFENFEENWKLIIDFPFDETGRNPQR